MKDRILSGHAPARGWRNPVPLVDVLRAAVAEVEDYTRIKATAGTPQVYLCGAAGRVTVCAAVLRFTLGRAMVSRRLTLFIGADKPRALCGLARLSCDICCRALRD